MTTLDDARTLARQAEQAFEATLRAAYPMADRWVWYRSLERAKEGRADKWDSQMAADATISAAHDQYIEKLHAFYLLRDGPGGVLGGKA